MFGEDGASVPWGGAVSSELLDAGSSRDGGGGRTCSERCKGNQRDPARCGRYNDASNYLGDCLKRRHTGTAAAEGKTWPFKMEQASRRPFFF